MNRINISTPEGVELLTAEQLWNEAVAEPAVLVEGPMRICAGQRVVIHGQPSSFKTMLALAAAIEVAAGGARSLVLAGEGSKSGLKKRLDGLARGRGLENLGSLGDLLGFGLGPFDATSEPNKAFVVDLIAEFSPILVVIDPLVTYFTGDENTVLGVGPFLRFLNQLVASGVAVLLVAHDRKPSRDRTPDIRGSSAFRGWADSMWGTTRISQSDGQIELTHEKERDADRSPDQQVTFDGCDGALVVRATARKKEGRKETRDLTDRVVDHLRVAGQPLTKAEIRSRTHASGDAINRAIDRLLENARVVANMYPRPDRNGRARTVEAYALPTNGRTDRPHDGDGPSVQHQKGSNHAKSQDN